MRNWIPERASGLCGCALVCLLCIAFVAGCGTASNRQPAAERPGRPDQEQLRLYAETEARLNSPDPEAREKAAIALLSMEEPAGARAVLEALTEAEDPAVRVSMIRAAAFTADQRCFAAVLSAVGDPDHRASEAAAAALARFNRPREVVAMVEYVSDPATDPARRRLLFRALGEGLALRAVPVLLAGLESEREETRLAAWQALRRIARRDLPLQPEKWRAWWETNRYRSREKLLEEHLREMSTELRLRTEDLQRMQSQHQALMDVVERLGEEDLSLLLRALGSPHPVVRRYASFRLVAAAERLVSGNLLDDQEVYAALREALQDDSPQVSRNVMQFVRKAGGQYKDALVREALKDEDPGVLVVAVQLVSATTGSETVGRLEELLAESPHAQVREEAANLLGKVGDEGSWQVLVEALDDPEENVRWFAVEGLRKLDATQAFPRVSEVLLNDGSARVRAQAAITLGELGQPASFSALRQALAGDGSEQVREKAAAALTALAEGSPETMSTVARMFREEGYLDRSRQILSRLIEQFADNPEAADRVLNARRELAGVMVQQEDFTAAAAVYEQLLADGHDGELRRKFIDSLLKAGETRRAVDRLKQWLAEGSDEPLLALTLDTAERLLGQDRREDASALVQLAAQQTDEGTDPSLKDRIQTLRQRLDS